VVSELSDILDEAEAERLIAERANLQIQRDAVMDRMDGVDGTLCGLQFQLDAVAARIAEIDDALVTSGHTRLLYNPENVAEVTHACPPDDGGGLMPCCGLTPFEVPRTDRMTLDPELVTCHKEGCQS
jgi:hypothetical protein